MNRLNRTLPQTGKAKKSAKVIINPVTDALDDYNWASRKLEALMQLLEVTDMSEFGSFVSEPMPYLMDIAEGLLDEMNQAFAKARVAEEKERLNSRCGQAPNSGA